ncbi:MAG: hypothetical protein RDU89_07100 [bacterium]|nr:hypothetical protein [bacterium]
MTRWVSLSETVEQLRRVAGGAPVPPACELRQAAGLLATVTHGPEMVFGMPAIVNCAALALSMPRLVVHRLSAGATRVVAETDLHSLPGEPPHLLRGPWLLEARRPEEPLFGQTASLGGYELDGVIYLVGLDHPDGVYVARWVPHWREEDLEAGIQRDDSPLIADVDAHHAWARDAARFAVVLGLLLVAEGSPLLADEEQLAPRRRGARAPRQPAGDSAEGWLVRRIHLGRITPSRQRAGEEAGAAADLSGRLPQTVPVRGHVKRQRYGPARAEVKWIYVDGYEARRWVAPRPLRIDVSG